MKVQQVATEDLRIDERYQREFRPWPKGTKFDNNLYEVIEVSRREDGDYVIRGQRRVRLAVESGVKKLTARVHTGLTFEEEARMYALDARGRVRQRPLELFKGDVAYGDEIAIAIQEACFDMGFDVGSVTVEGNIEAIITLRKIYNSYGIELVRETLFVLAEWTEGAASQEARSGAFLDALATYLATHRKLTREQLERLYDTPPEVIYLRAKNTKNGFHGGGGMKQAILRGLNRAAGTKQLMNVHRSDSNGNGLKALEGSLTSV